MSISPLIPVAGAAGIFAARAAQSLAGGISFANIFRQADAAQPSASVASPATEAAGKKSAEAAVASSDPKKLLGDFQDLMMSRLAAAGIDISQPFELRTLGQDGVKVSGDHSDWAKIEQMFEEHPDLRDAFQRVADAFAQQSSSDRRNFQLSLAEGEASVSFE